MCELDSLAHADIEVELDTLGINAIEQSRYIFGSHQFSFYTKCNGIDPGCDEFLCTGIGLGCIAGLYVNTHQPAVAGIVTSCIREHTGLQVLTAGRQILLAVEGVHIEAFGGSPNHLLVVWDTFQVLHNLVFPILGRYRREIAE